MHSRIISKIRLNNIAKLKSQPAKWAIFKLTSSLCIQNSWILSFKFWGVVREREEGRKRKERDWDLPINYSVSKCGDPLLLLHRVLPCDLRGLISRMFWVEFSSSTIDYEYIATNVKLLMRPHRHLFCHLFTWAPCLPPALCSAVFNTDPRLYFLS